MTSADFNLTSVTSLTLDGFAALSGHSLLFFFVFLLLYLFVLFSDSLVVYVICSQRSLRRPMFAFVAAVLLNSLVGSTMIYPKLLSDLSDGGIVQVTRSTCLVQAFMLYSLGSSSYMLLSAMAFDRYLSICRPLRYAALVSPASVAALLLLCWLLPAALVSGAVLLASRLPLCHSRFSRINCDIYSFIKLSCGGAAALLSDVYGLMCFMTTVLLPTAFVLFTYGRILFICLRRSRSCGSKALHTCLPHLLVFINYSISTALELLHRRLQAENEPVGSVVTFIMTMSPTVLNPVIYGLKVKEVRRHVRRLLSCQRDS